jgi:hypothetical protein
MCLAGCGRPTGLMSRAALRERQARAMDAIAVINSLSTLAIAILTGAYVYTTRSQLRVMRGQLEEIQRSRDYVAQPLPIASIKKIRIERPRLYYAPPIDEFSVLSRYFVDFELANRGSHPALSVDVTIDLIPNGESDTSTRWRSLSDFYEAVPHTAESGAYTGSAMFPRDLDAKLLDALLRNNFIGPRGWPVVIVTALFRNIAGACFIGHSAYYVFRKSQDEVETISNWQLNITTFKIQHEQEIRKLADLQHRQDERYDAEFDVLKTKIAESIIGDEYLECGFAQFPRSMQVKSINEAEYDRIISTHGYGTTIPGWLEKCIHLDADN